jgi:hypothetical protein
LAKWKEALEIEPLGNNALLYTTTKKNSRTRHDVVDMIDEEELQSKKNGSNGM